MKKKTRRPSGPRGLHTHRSEQLLIEHLEDLLPGNRLLCTTQGRAQLAAVAALRSPTRQVTCQFLDQFRMEESQRLHGDGIDRLRLLCTADFPEEAFDAAALPFTATGESELVREQMQTAYLRLVEGGRMAVATDNPRDTFFHDEMRTLFPKVTRIDDPRGRVYLGTKRGPLKRVRDFSAELAFRDGERLIKLFTRPGVFSHRRLDSGTRALLETIDVRPGMRILDLGCGAGAVAAAVALRAANVTVEAVDSNPRAIACTQQTCTLNGVSTVRTHLDAAARCGEKNSLDVAAGNPPYYSNFRIAKLFLDSAVEALRPGGKALFVTKHPDWFETSMAERFTHLISTPVRNYVIVSGIKSR